MLSFAGVAIALWAVATFPLLMVSAVLGGDVMLGLHPDADPRTYRRALRYSRLAHALRHGALFKVFVASTVLFVLTTVGYAVSDYSVVFRPVLEALLTTALVSAYLTFPVRSVLGLMVRRLGFPADLWARVEARRVEDRIH